MATTKKEWECDGDVSYEYFNNAGFCTHQHIQEVLEKIKIAFPDYYIYLGITHNPCGRWTLNYNKSFLPQFRRNELVVEGCELFSELLSEAAHKDSFEKMFVICYYDSEAKIRKAEQDTISIARGMAFKGVLNKTKGKNGPLPDDATFYFLYVCISKTSVIID